MPRAAVNQYLSSFEKYFFSLGSLIFRGRCENEIFREQLPLVIPLSQLTYDEPGESSVEFRIFRSSTAERTVKE